MVLQNQFLCPRENGLYTYRYTIEMLFAVENF